MRLDHLLSKRLSKGCFTVELSGKRQWFCERKKRIKGFPEEVAEQLPTSFATQKTIYPVPMRLWDTPVPIPNTMVKTLPADDTRLETARESRRLPDYLGV